MSKFETQLNELVVNYKKNISKSDCDDESELKYPQGMVPAFKIVYNKFEQSIDLFNKQCGSQALFIEDLSVEIFKLLLTFDDINSCFFLRSMDKLVFVFNEGQDQIAFFGKNKSVEKQKVNPRFVQLFKITATSVNDKTEFKDNTGMHIDIEEVAVEVIRWLVS